jgi:hypothetical protein
VTATDVITAGIEQSTITSLEAQTARSKNVFDLCLGFSAMTQVFAKTSEDLILKRLEGLLQTLPSVSGRYGYERLHAEFCDWFARTIRTAPREYKNGVVKQGRACSYGQTAKVLDVASKVYVHIAACRRPKSPPHSFSCCTRHSTRG